MLPEHVDMIMLCRALSTVSRAKEQTSQEEGLGKRPE